MNIVFSLRPKLPKILSIWHLRHANSPLQHIYSGITLPSLDMWPYRSHFLHLSDLLNSKNFKHLISESAKDLVNFNFIVSRLNGTFTCKLIVVFGVFYNDKICLAIVKDIRELSHKPKKMAKFTMTGRPQILKLH